MQCNCNSNSKLCPIHDGKCVVCGRSGHPDIFSVFQMKNGIRQPLCSEKCSEEFFRLT